MKFVLSLHGDRNVCEWTVDEFKEKLAGATPGEFTVFEYLTSDMKVKPYFDYDCKVDKYQSPQVHAHKV